MQAGWYGYQNNTSQILLVGRHRADQWGREKYAFLLPSVFRTNYIGVIFTKKCFCDALSSNRTRKFKMEKKIHSSCNSLCMAESLTLGFSADFSGFCVRTETLPAPGRGGE